MQRVRDLGGLFEKAKNYFLLSHLHFMTNLAFINALKVIICKLLKKQF